MTYVAKLVTRMPRIGDGLLIRRTLKQEDFNLTAEISGDCNPIHIDPEYCAKTRFKKPVAHGILLFGLIKTAIWKLLGSSVEYVGQELTFPNPTYAGERITVWVSVSDVQKEQGLVTLDTFIIKPKGDVSCRGRCTLRLLGEIEGKAAPTTKSVSYEKLSLEVGARASIKKTFTIDILRKRANLLRDRNPVHISERQAKRLGFKQPIVPEDMLMAMISYLLGMKLPGPGTGWLRQDLRFLKPAYVGEELTCTVEISRLRPEKGLVNLNTYCTNSRGEKVLEGEALVILLESYGK